MDNPFAVLRVLLLAVLFAPLVAAVVTGLAGSAGRNPRRFAVWFAGLHLGVTALMAGMALVELNQREEESRGKLVGQAEVAFRPTGVPGDEGAEEDGGFQTHHTTWALLSLGAATGPDVPPPDIQFFVGLDGLNVWLVLLTSLMTLVAVLLSWESVTERPGGFFAWLFVLQLGVTGAFLAFDIILFYVFFELTLIPSFFLIGSWGVGGGRRDAARKFFLYTLFGSLLTLVGIVGIVLTNPTPVHPVSGRLLLTTGPAVDSHVQLAKAGPVTFSVPQLMRNVSFWANYDANRAVLAQWSIDTAKSDADRARAADELAAARADRRAAQRVEMWLFFALMAGFAVKMAVVPFHTWLPPAYAEAPIGVTMLFSAVLAKLGAFGVLRLVLPLTPDAAAAYGLPVFGTLGAVGIIYGAFCAFAQRDMKVLTAYSSVSHLGFLVLGLFTFNLEGLAGGALHMVNHGLATGAMFALLGFLAVRYRTLDMNQYGGLIAHFPAYAFFLFVACLASIGLPGLNNFVSEMLMLAGLFDPTVTRVAGYGLAAAAAFGILLSAWYVLTMLRRVLFGPPREPAAPGEVRGLTGRECFAFGVLAALCLALGVYPHPVLDTMKSDVDIVAKIGQDARLRASVLDQP
jgi:NADH-quinone oxidoreductase subunit M